MKFRSWIRAALATFCGVVAAAAPDGPYVLRGENGWESHSISVDSNGTATVRKQLTGSTGTAQIAAVGAVPAFAVTLRDPAPVASDVVTTAAKAPLFVVADTHGEYQILVTMLRAHKVVGPKLEWKFARGHLVVLGDVFDRGPNHLEILWLLYKLEAEARKAGGGVHLVLGNHETMVMRGDLRYLNPKYVETSAALGKTYGELFAADTLLGQWLRTRASMLRINDLLCLHAGVSRALLDSTLTLGEINEAVRAALAPDAGGSATAELVMGSLGPLWYRGYFPEQASFTQATPQDVDQTLQMFGARRILIGHTIVPTVTPLFGGKVIAVQVQPKQDDSGKGSFEALLIRGAELSRAGIDGGLTRLVAPQR